VKRSICAMGHKWMWNPRWGGLPPQSFLSKVDALFDGIRDKIGCEYLTSNSVAGTLSEKWAAEMGLKPGIPIPVGAFDAHWDAIGFAAIEGTAFHTRIILERMAEHGVPVERVINAGGIPQNNAVLNQIYADVLGKPVLVPDGTPTSLGSGIFALMAVGAFTTIEEAQKNVCLPYRNYEPQAKSVAVYNELYPLYRTAYFALGQFNAAATPLGAILPDLRRIAAAART
jgi:ribulose kinase